MLRAVLLALTFSGMMVGLSACHRTPSAQMPGDPADHRAWSAISPQATIIASGTEPFWSVRVRDGKLLYATPEQPAGTSIMVSRFAGRGGVSFSGELEGRPLTLAVGAGPCSDGMSDRKWPYGATLRLGEHVLSGCAQVAGKKIGKAAQPTVAPVSNRRESPKSLGLTAGSGA